MRGIDIEVRRGEVFGLLGPNGAGKTTTVEILEGYRTRTSGEVSVLGYDPARRQLQLRRRIGIVLQAGGIYSYLTPREALAHWARFYPAPRAVEEVLALVGLSRQADVRSRKLSGGQLRRLDLALALVGDPELMFLDEPTTGFDPEARRDAWDTVRQLRDLGKTVLLTTHYLDEAQALADRVAIVKDGRILAIGPPRELVTHSSGAHPPGARSPGAHPSVAHSPEAHPSGAHSSVAHSPEAHPSGAHSPGARLTEANPPGALGTGPQHYRVAWRDAEGRLQERETEDPTGLLHELTSEALARGERLDELSVGHPTLEDVYLELTADA